MKSSRSAAVIISALLLVGIAIGIFRFNAFTPADDVPKETVVDEEIVDLELVAEHANIVLVASADQKTRVKISGKNASYNLYTFAKEKKLVVETENKASFFSFGSHSPALLTIYVPKIGARTLNIKINEGALQMKSVDFYELIAATTKGNIVLENLDMKNIIAKTQDGKIDLRHVDAALVQLESSKGDIYLENTEAVLTAKSAEGNIQFVTEQLYSPADLETGNGNITIKTKTEPLDMRIESAATTGKIDISGKNAEQATFGEGTTLSKLTAKNGDILLEIEE